MDASELLQCFAGTLDQNTEIRSQAEQRLKQVSPTPGFLGATLDIISAEKTPESVRLSASLYFKNKCVAGWTGKQNNKNELIYHMVDQDEKPVIKDTLTRALITCVRLSPSSTRILKNALSVIIYEEYSQGSWDDLLTQSTRLLSSTDVNEAYVGLLCLNGIFKTYRWKENDSRQGLEKLILQYFPDLLKYGEAHLLSQASHLNDKMLADMLLLLIKIYKFVTYLDLPFTLQRQESFIPWANFFVSIIQLPLPAELMTAYDNESRIKNPWVKCKKWAYAILYRLFQRYASDSLTRKFEYHEFKSLYREEFLPQLLQLFFQQIEQWWNGHLWLSDESFYYILSFIEQTVVQKTTWKLIQPHYLTLLEHVIFPLLCPDDTKLEVFETDPQEYIHRNLELWDENYSPDLAAVSLLTTVVNKHGKTALPPTIQFIMGTLQANVGNATDLGSAVKIESALRIFSSILDRLMMKDSPYLNELEPFLTSFVFPFFESPFGFLRTRVCEICSKLGTMNFERTILIDTIYKGIAFCMNDTTSCLPEQLMASLALQAFIHVPEFHVVLSSSVLPIMQKLLSISNEFETDTISGVMQDFVEQFADQLQPFGVDLMNSLVQQLLKLVIELHEASNVDPDSLIDGNDMTDESDKQMAALGILSTTISILLSFENSPEMVRNLEQSFYPAAEFILKYEVEDFYHECCEFVENSTFLLRDISPISWKILELIGQSNSGGSGMVSFYLEDCIYALSNYMLYGADELKKNEFYFKILYEIYSKASHDEDKGPSDLVTVFDLSQKIVLSLGHQLSEPYFHKIIDDAAQAIILNENELKDNIIFGVTTCNVIASGLAYFPQLTLNILLNRQCLQIFFKTWLEYYVPNVKRVFDIKISLLALLSLITDVPQTTLDTLFGGLILPKLGKIVVNLIARFPETQRQLEEKRVEFSTGSLTLDNSEDLENDPATLKFVDGNPLESEQDFDDLEEDSLSGSLLDTVDIYASIKLFIINLKNADKEKSIAMFSEITPHEQETLNKVLSS